MPDRKGQNQTETIPELRDKNIENDQKREENQEQERKAIRATPSPPKNIKNINDCKNTFWFTSSSILKLWFLTELKK